MLAGLTLAGIIMLVSGGIFPRFIKDKRDKYLYILAAAGLVIRLISAASIRGYGTDMSCFISWSERLFKDGFGDFYTSGGFVDYPPGYLYLLYIIGAVRNVFNMGFNSPPYYVLVKLPSVICDILCGVAIYKFAGEKNKTGFVAGVGFIFNPMVWFDSCLWGQVDSVFTLAILLALMTLTRKKYNLSAMLYAAALLIKPQAVIVFPVYLFNIIEMVRDEGKKGIRESLLATVCGVAVFFAAAMPFSKNLNPLWIFDLYTSTLSSYKLATLNAPNLFGLAGGNGIGMDGGFMGLTFAAWSTIFILLITALSAAVYFGGKKRENVFDTAAFLMAGMYVLSAKMHERYFYPVFAFFLVSYVLNGKKLTVVLYVIFTFVVYEASAWVLSLDMTTGYPWISETAIGFKILSALSVAAFLVMAADLLKNPVKNLSKSNLIILCMCIFYGITAFINSGECTTPQRGVTVNKNQEIILKINGESEVAQVSVFNGIKPADKGLTIRASKDGVNYSEEIETENLEVFAWQVTETDLRGEYISLRANSDMEIKEIALFDHSGARLDYTADFKELKDEQSSATNRVTYKNGTYFDEIYHARTAFEYTHGIEAYEWTHPPLGKLIMSLGITLFGMNPFGWRSTGIFLGIIIIPLMYLLARELFDNEKWGIAAAFLMMFDFMHFTQTRIATIDTYAVFFIMLMYLHMFKFFKTDYTENMSKALKYLMWCGIFFGLGVASKWTCLYGGVGLALIFFIKLLLERKRSPFSSAAKLMGACVLFFVIIPILIYWVSYLPYAFVETGPRDIFDIFEIQKNMFSYHSELKDDHFFKSMWYEWPVMKMPVWYFVGEGTKEGMVSSISAFGNPAIWWGSLAATAAMIVFAAGKRKEALYLPMLIFIGYLSQYLPWVGVKRVVFIYHYFTALPFIILITVYVARELKKLMNPSYFKMAAVTFAVAVVGLFIMFYPAISGFEVPKEYMKNALMWFDTWYFGG